MAEDVPHEAADRLGCGVAGRGGDADEVRQPLLAEELPVGRAGLGDAVGVEHQAVAGLQPGLAADRPVVLQTQWAAGWAVRRPHQRRATHDEGFGVAGVDPQQPPGVDVQAGEHRGGELTGAELGGDRGVDLHRDVRQVKHVAAGVPVGTDRDTGQHRGRQPVPDRVDHQQVHHAAVDGVVEGVATDVVGRLQPAGDDHPLGAEGHRGQELPLHLRGQGQGLAAAQPGEHVAVGVVDHDQLGDEADERPEVVYLVAGGRLPEDQLGHAEPLDPLQQRQPEPVAVLGGAVDHLDPAERPPGHRPLDR